MAPPTGTGPTEAEWPRRQFPAQGHRNRSVTSTPKRPGLSRGAGVEIAILVRKSKSSDFSQKSKSFYELFRRINLENELQKPDLRTLVEKQAPGMFWDPSDPTKTRLSAKVVNLPVPVPPAPLPEPPITADVDLRSYHSMMIDIRAVRDSDAFLRGTGEEFRAAFSLWREFLASAAGVEPA